MKTDIQKDEKSEQTRNGRNSRMKLRPKYQLITLAFGRLLIEEKKDRYNSSDWQRKDVRKVERFMLTFMS